MGSITSFGNFAKVLNQILWFCMTWSTEEAWQSEIKILREFCLFKNASP